MDGRVPEGATLEVDEPGRESIRGEVPVRTPEEVEAAVERARGAQAPWGGIPPRKRAARLGRLVEVLGAETETVVEEIRRETGKPEVEALAEILASVELVRYYRKKAPRVLERRRVGTGWVVGKSAYTRREPWGVVGVITPWNYPFLLAMDSVTAALFAGNAVVLKPSEHTPFSSALVADLVEKAELPENLVQVVTGDGRTGAALASSDVDKIVFTGSPATGRKVMEAAAGNLTPVALELGGKDPAVVLADADLERAAHGVVHGAFYNAGQTCISTERVFVEEALHDRFAERVTELVRELRAGTRDAYDVGPMVTPDQMEIVESHVSEAVESGARALTGGGRVEGEPDVFAPTVLVDVDPSMKVACEESFGPVLPIVKVRDADEAVRLVNESRYGLFGSVWTSDLERGRRIAHRLELGGVSVNDTLTHYVVPGLPMGGVGESGFGSRRGVEGLEEMSRPRSILVHRVGMTPELWWYPYTEGTSRLMRAILDVRGRLGVTGFLKGLARAAARMTGRGSG